MKNNRTFLDKLLDGAEVEWKPLGDVCNFQNGFAFKSSLFKDNGSPIVRITNIDGGRVNLSDVKYFLMDDYNTDMAAYEVHKDDILIAMSGATTGKIGFYNYEHTSYLNQRVGKFLPNTNILNNRYLYHYLLSKVEDIYIISGGGAQPNLSSNRLMSEVLIPIPPLSVQTEIVKILDALTALTSELTSELTLRRKQYEYYREKLLSVDNLKLSIENIQWVKLNDLGELIRGNGLQKKDFTETGVPAIHYGQIYTYYGTFATETKSFVSPELAKKLKKVDCGDVVITNTSENFEDVGKAMVYLGKEQAVTGGHATIFKPNHEKILSKYFVYLTQTSFFTNEKRKYAKGTKVIDVSATDMAKIILPIPPLKEQQRIVSILDKFETLTNSITEGLPLAIEQSQKRYEYYRELLLNFE